MLLPTSWDYRSKEIEQSIICIIQRHIRNMTAPSLKSILPQSTQAFECKAKNLEIQTTFSRTIWSQECTENNPFAPGIIGFQPFWHQTLFLSCFFDGIRSSTWKVLSSEYAATKHMNDYGFSWIWPSQTESRTPRPETIAGSRNPRCSVRFMSKPWPSWKARIESDCTENLL